MRLEVLLPFQVFADESDVMRIVVQTPSGSFGLLPRRLDCVAALSPGILIYQTATAAEVYFAVDEGVLVKAGDVVRVSVRRALRGTDLDHLRDAVAQEFAAQNAQAQALRTAMLQVEGGLLRRVARYEQV